MAWDTPAVDPPSQSNDRPRSAEAEDIIPNHYLSEDVPQHLMSASVPLGSEGSTYPTNLGEEGSLTRRRSTGDIHQSPSPVRKDFLDVEVKQPVRELEGTKDTFVSYLVVARVGYHG